MTVNPWKSLMSIIGIRMKHYYTYFVISWRTLAATDRLFLSASVGLFISVTALWHAYSSVTICSLIKLDDTMTLRLSAHRMCPASLLSVVTVRHDTKLVTMFASRPSVKLSLKIDGRECIMHSHCVKIIICDHFSKKRKNIAANGNSVKLSCTSLWKQQWSPS